MRQAVLVIHGIGDQKPMETIRSFVDAVIEDEPTPTPSQELKDRDSKAANPTKPKFWNKPDSLSGLFELRRFSVRKKAFTDTDFYEFYWAHLMKNTKLGHVLSWVWILLWSNPLKIPTRLRPIWVLSVVLIGTSAFYLYHAFTFYGELSNFLMIDLSKGLLAFILLIVFNYFMLTYLGDAARYFSASPGNVEIRQKIREEGVKLLRNLHHSKRYDRIIVVGHSLGSVIAYDILKYYWIEVNRKHGSPSDLNQTALDHLEKMVYNKRQQSSHLSADRAFIENFQKKQRALWIEQRNLGNPWLVTDLITLGSPLAHASFLFTKSKEELEMRQRERELPICPPILEDKKFSFPMTYNLDATTTQTINILHHSALFSATRWTNLYFEGDFIGGPLRKTFGFGIYDMAVRTKSKYGEKFPNSHTKYWEKINPDSLPTEGTGYLSIHALCNAINLNAEEWLKEVKG